MQQWVEKFLGIRLRPEQVSKMMSLVKGRQLRDDGMAAALSAEDEAYKERFLEEWIRRENTRKPFFTDDVKAVVGSPRRANSIGGLVNGRVRNGNVEVWGYVQMTASQAHARRTPQYVGTNW